MEENKSSSTELLELKMVEEKAAAMKEEEVVKNGGVGSGAWPSLKPFVNGFLTGQLMILPSCMVYWFLKDYTPAAEWVFGPHHKIMINAIGMNMPRGCISHAIYTTARFGMFETLTKKAVAANSGTPITIYQEACCGLIAGGIASSIYYPFDAHMRRQTVEHKWNYRNIIHPLYSSIRKDGFLALWKGASPFIAKNMGLNMGMMVSYGRSLNYLEESIGVGQTKAILGAGVVSAFFATPCGNLCELSVMIKNALRKRKYPYMYIPYLAFEVLKPGGKAKFYSGTFSEFVKSAPVYAFQWITLEDIRKFEESIGF